MISKSFARLLALLVLAACSINAAGQSTGKGGKNNFVTTRVVGDGGRVTPINRAVPPGMTADFNVWVNPGLRYSVSGCAGGKLVGTTYTVSPTADCEIVLTIGEDDTAPDPVLSLVERPMPWEYLSGVTESARSDCPYDEMGIDWRRKSFPPKQISGPATMLTENWMNLWYKFTLPLSAPQGEAQEIVYQCSGINAKGELVIRNQTHVLRGFPKKVLGEETVGVGFIRSPVVLHSAKYGKRMYFEKKSSASETGLAKGTNLELLTNSVIGTGNLPAWAGGVAEPQTAFFRNGKYHMWLNGSHGYGHAESRDGESWFVDATPLATGPKVTKVVPFKGVDLVYVKELDGVYKVGKSSNGAPVSAYEPVIFGGAWAYTAAQLQKYRKTMVATRVVFNNVEYVLAVVQHGIYGAYVFLSEDGVTFRAEQNFMWGPPVNTVHVIQDVSVAEGKLVVCGVHEYRRGKILCDTRSLSNDLAVPGYVHTYMKIKPNYDESAM